MVRGIFEGVLKAAAGIAIALVLLMPVAIIADVLSRALFSKPLPVVFEGTEYAMLWVPLLAAPIITWYNDHIVVDLIDGAYNTKRGALIRTIATIASALISVVFLSVLAVMAWDSVVQAFTGGYVMQTTLAPPRWLIHSVIPVSATLCAFTFAVFLVSTIAKTMRRSPVAAARPGSD
ncbi:TRAP transporter small permease [Microbacterium album]|uniref:Tripartite ATP-independent periplasmic transporters DctQ component domain-containing protein n=1 Tax=Microbacterium album TaxID=2053191 RepID=A0A917IHU8_9MICO|nr:TRAP transporter small permease [Microbacterium album]GGH47444.1 hypothetical protein GCM10010921_24170 [Microbacterium album]